MSCMNTSMELPHCVNNKPRWVFKGIKDREKYHVLTRESLVSDTSLARCDDRALKPNKIFDVGREIHQAIVTLHGLHHLRHFTES